MRLAAAQLDGKPIAPAVSVLMPVYNARRYLTEAVGSILAQTFGDFELIAVDDGSTDGSGDLLRDFASGDSRLRLVSRPNAGYTVSLNEALSLARGALVARMDADDVSAPDRFRRQVDFLAAHPQCVAVGARVLLIDADGAALCEMPAPESHEEIDAAHLRGTGSFIVHPTAMMRRAALLAVGGYRPGREPAEDLDLFLRLAEVGRLANVREVLLRYRQHASSVSHSRRRQQLRAARAVAEEAKQRRGLTAGGRSVSADGPTASPDPHQTWAWLALSAGNVSTARKHARAALWRAPWRPASWRVMYCALRGR